MAKRRLDVSEQAGSVDALRAEARELAEQLRREFGLEMRAPALIRQELCRVTAQNERNRHVVARVGRAAAGRAKGATAARAEKVKKRASPEVQRAERRRDADIRYLIRDGDSDREIAEKMRARRFRIGRGKIAEIRRAMRLGGPL